MKTYHLHSMLLTTALSFCAETLTAPKVYAGSELTLEQASEYISTTIKLSLNEWLVISRGENKIINDHQDRVYPEEYEWKYTPSNLETVYETVFQKNWSTQLKLSPFLTARFFKRSVKNRHFADSALEDAQRYFNAITTPEKIEFINGVLSDFEVDPLGAVDFVTLFKAPAGIQYAVDKKLLYQAYINHKEKYRRYDSNFLPSEEIIPEIFQNLTTTERSEMSIIAKQRLTSNSISDVMGYLCLPKGLQFEPLTNLSEAEIAKIFTDLNAHYKSNFAYAYKQALKLAQNNLDKIQVEMMWANGSTSLDRIDQLLDLLTSLEKQKLKTESRFSLSNIRSGYLFFGAKEETFMNPKLKKVLSSFDIDGYVAAISKGYVYGSPRDYTWLRRMGLATSVLNNIFTNEQLMKELYAPEFRGGPIGVTLRPGDFETYLLNQTPTQFFESIIRNIESKDPWDRMRSYSKLSEWLESPEVLPYQQIMLDTFKKFPIEAAEHFVSGMEDRIYRNISDRRVQVELVEVLKHFGYSKSSIAFHIQVMKNSDASIYINSKKFQKISKIPVIRHCDWLLSELF